MCRIRTLIKDGNDKIQKDIVIDVKGLTLSVIDTPSFCIYTGRNFNGFENIIFKYPSSTEPLLHLSSASSQTIMTVGRNSGCIYAYQYKSNIGLSELAEMKKTALQESKKTRYQTNVSLMLRLLEQVHENVENFIR